jgi:uncharacterized protein YlxW (UPF0749 family)
MNEELQKELLEEEIKRLQEKRNKLIKEKIEIEKTISMLNFEEMS